MHLCACTHPRASVPTCTHSRARALTHGPISNTYCSFTAKIIRKMRTLFKILSDIAFPSNARFSKWSLSRRFSHRNPICSSLPLHKRYMPRPSNVSWFYHTGSIWFRVQIIKLFIVQFSSFPRYNVGPRPKFLPHPILDYPHYLFLPQCKRPSMTTIENNWQSYNYIYFYSYVFGKQTERHFPCSSVTLLC